MKFLSLFSIAAVLGVVFFVSAEHPVKTKSDGPYTVSALSERQGLAVQGKVKVEGNRRAVNYSWHMSFCRLDPWVPLGSASNPTEVQLNGAFGEKLKQPEINVNIPGKLYGAASAWGSATDDKWYHASVPDTSN